MLRPSRRPGDCVSQGEEPAYCTRAEVELLEVKGLQFDPDVVILVFVENDFDNFNREAFPLGGTIERPAVVESLFARSHLFRLACVQCNLFHFGFCIAIHLAAF